MQTKTGALRKIRRILAILFFTLCLIGGSFFLITRLFRVKSIEIIGEGIENIQIDETRFSPNLLFFPKEQLIAELLKVYPQLMNVEIRKKFPHTLVLVLPQRQAVARIESSGRFVLLSADAVVLGPATADVLLPLLRIPLDSIPQRGGKTEDVRILSALKILESFDKDRKPSLIDIYDEASLRAKIDKTDIIFAHNSDLTQRLATLQTLLVGFRIQARMPARIDLRYQKPVVTF